MKHRILKYLTLFMTIVALLSFANCGCNEDDVNSKPLLPPPLAHIFNTVTNCFEWSAIEKADSYQVKYNGQEYTVTEPAFAVELKDDIVQIEVRAVDSTGKYNPSIWAHYSYTLPLEE